MFDTFKSNSRRIQRQEDRIAALEEAIDKLSDERDTLLEVNHKLKLDKDSSERELKEKYDALAKKKQMEEEEIAHKLKMREGQLELAKEQEIAKIKASSDEKVRKVKFEYADKYEEQLKKRGDELREMYSEILERLPNVSLAVRQQTKVLASDN